MNARPGIALTGIVFALLSQANAQTLHLANVSFSGGCVSFDVSAPAGISWSAQAGPTPAGPWSDFASFTGVARARVSLCSLTAPETYFRAQGNGSVSDNIAGVVQIPLAAGYNLLANPLDDGRGNLLTNILSGLPEGTLVEEFDTASQTWAAVSQVELGTWNTTNRALPPGRGFWLAAPTTATNALVFTGFVPAAPAPTPVPGWNQLGWMPSSDQFPAGQGGDQVLLYRSGGYVTTDFDPAQGWSNAPMPATGEGFWYFRAQGAPTSAPCLYFNNYVPFANTTPRLFYEASPLAGAAWRAQLYGGVAGVSPANLQPLGVPLPMLTGPGVGYVDASSNACVTLPNSFSGGEVELQLRFWEAAAGETYEQAVAAGGEVGQTTVFSLTTVPAAPAPPGLLTGIGDPGSNALSAWLKLSVDGLGDLPATGTLAVGGQAGAAYTVQQSADLVHWTNVVSIPSLPPAGTNLSLDLPATPRFFRATSP